MSKRYEIAPLKWVREGELWLTVGIDCRRYVIRMSSNGLFFLHWQDGARCSPLNNPYYSLRGAKRAARRHNRQLILPALVEVPS
jgi:hypothetical protein